MDATSTSAHVATSPTSQGLPAAAGGAITAHLVGDGDRMDFLPKHFGRQFLLGEMAIYQTMDTLCRSYSGGFWDFIELSNGGFYLRLQSKGPLAICVPTGNDFAGELSPDGAGIVVTLFALNQLLWAGMRELSDAYYLLRDYARQHEESAKIFMAID
jgi:Antirestriction protein